MRVKENKAGRIVVFVILMIALLSVLRWLTGKIITVYWDKLLFNELCVLVIVYTINKVYFKIPLAFKREKLKKGVLLGIPVLIPALINYSQIKQIPTITLTIKLIFFSIIVGCFEEILFRGVLLRSLARRWQGLKNGSAWALIVTSLFFGLAHLTNLTHQSLGSTLYQVEFAFSLGMILGGIYLRSHNLFLCIFLHALIDSGAFIANWMNKSITISLPIIWILIVGIIIFTPYCLLGLFYIRPNKQMELLK
ncbi:CPBP family intramembrane glutamic endopeptidase [Liquorilactobacillus capillatus]|uniref:CAAX prenyl protease 2/Lysostaphin resistance protein A-like domain-containing protein n=1 Tax=Liquorilactobacillus capillatus DSM 19910 TaxID=1423731 RepID=A0A0R1MD29_9LACO|nr:CPBP family intramembrane glutamic endopeptidase [Liquorilactobacillus capillatus]KRL02187.1 hypothetical protein FC81_GL000950 [Liquorilactobacillus capillatus DSM 19910]